MLVHLLAAVLAQAPLPAEPISHPTLGSRATFLADQDFSAVPE